MSEFLKTSLEYVLHKPISGSRPKGGVSAVGEIPSLGGENITMEGGLKLEAVKKISSEFFKSMPQGQLKNLDVLINKDGANTGKSTIYRKSPFLNAAVNEHLFILRGKEGKLDQEYLHYLLQFSLIRAILEIKITGSAQPGINTTFVKNFPVDLAPFLEQKKIASILTSVDEVIDSAQKQIDKLEDLKKATMNELLTKGIGHTEFKDSELGRIPKSWKVKKLKDIGECIRGLIYSPKDIAETGLLVLRSSNIQHGRIHLDDNVFVNLDLTTNFRTQVGDLLICVRNGSRRLLGKSAVIPEGLPPSTHGAFMTVFRTPQNEFVQFLLQSGWFFTQVSRDIGATINSINNSNLLEYLFAFPPHHEQTQIASQLKSIEALIVGKSNKLSQTQYLKKSLMQDLLTGKIRVTVN